MGTVIPAARSSASALERHWSAVAPSEYVGHASPDDEVVVRGDLSTHEYVAYWLRDGVVTAGMNVNVWDVSDRLCELIGTRVDPAQLTDLR